VVAVCLANVWQYVALETAVPACNAVLLPLPPRLGRHEIEFALQRTQPRLVVVDRQGQEWEQAADGFDVVPVDALRSDRTDAPDEQPSGDPRRVVEIALTSGTTGMPKLAALTAQLKQLTSEAFCSRLGIGPGDRMLPMSPISQGVGEICMYALRGGAGLVMARNRHFDADEVLRLAQRSRATLLGGVPTMIGRLLHAPAFAETDLSRVRAAAVAGAPLPVAVAREWERRASGVICNFYGAMDIGHLAVVRPSDPPHARWTSVGRPHATADWQVCTPDGTAAPAGVEGEICMRGPLVQARYWNSTETPFAADGWAHFGDLGFVDDDGYLHITGRVKDTIIRGGSNINPYEVEGLLRQHPDVRDVAVIGRPDPDLGERAVAFVVGTPGREPTLDELIEVLDQAGLARYKWPESLIALDTLPLATTGKPDRAALRASLQTSSSDPTKG
jgi:acyl-CoA synthetase (AMP-forming)/AMP-acid ligase II